MSLFSLIISHGYLLIFILLTIEGTTVNIVSAFASSLGYFDVRIIYLLALLGNTISDNAFYFIGYYLLSKTAYRRFTKKKHIKKIVELSNKRLVWSLMLVKLSPFAPIGLTLIGANKPKFKRYFIWSLITTALLVFLVTLIGYYYGYATKSMLNYLTISQYFIASVVILVLLVFVTTKLIMKKIKRKDLNSLIVYK